MEKHVLGIMSIIVAVAIAGLVSLQEPETTGMAARKIIVHHGMSYDELNREAGGRVSLALLSQYGIKIIDENKVATPGRKPVMVMMQMQNKHQSNNMMRNYESDKMLKKY
ncbi:MAG: hypothetical protein HY363_03565 [Candidatus Aenigmarchaeota archaeon]|nr:hypothetical protein [Candidatus Aenigmarchaeota archaeon]